MSQAKAQRRELGLKLVKKIPIESSFEKTTPGPQREDENTDPLVRSSKASLCSSPELVGELWWRD